MATTSSAAVQTKPDPALQRLSAETHKAVARAEAAKQMVRTAKAELKKVRKAAKAAKKAARHAKKKMQSARAASARSAAVKAVRRTSKAAPTSKRGAAKATLPAQAPAGKKAAKSAGRRTKQAPRSGKASAKPRRSAANVAKSVVKRLAAVAGRDAANEGAVSTAASGIPKGATSAADTPIATER